MREKSRARMERILGFVEDDFRARGRAPSTTRIAAAAGVARGTAHKYLVEMDRRGLLSYQGGVIETARMRRALPEATGAELLGAVPCGLPQVEEAESEAFVSLPCAIFGRGELYILRARGDSMVGAGIEDGDLVVVRRQDTAREGDIVVALVKGENTLKRYYTDKRRRCVRLHPENPALEDIFTQDCRIQGVARHIIKAL